MKKPDVQIWPNKILASYSTLDIGKEASYLVEVFSLDGMKKAFAFAHEKKLPFYVIGNGSNILFWQDRTDAVIIHNAMQGIEQIDEENFCVKSGTLLPLLSHRLTCLDLAGLEFGQGIPASIGGAIFMNASAHNQAISDCLMAVHYLQEDGTLKWIEKKDLFFGYRDSSFRRLKGAIIEAKLSFKKGKEVKERQQALLSQRKRTQPLDTKNIGCIFKNPNSNLSAGYLIEQAGLKGFAIHDAEVSSLHANFIINKNRASAKDVLALIAHIKKIVFEKFKIILDEEICYLPPYEK